jgi:signal transduction histidine kinase
MFYVFAVDVVAAERKARKLQLIRLKAEPAEDYLERVEAHVAAAIANSKPVRMAKYGVRDLAEKYAAALRDLGGYDKISVRVHILTEPRGRGGMPGHRYVAIEDVTQQDRDAQERLQGMLAGSQFA